MTNRLETIRSDIQAAQDEIQHLMSIIRSIDALDTYLPEINTSLTCIDTKVKRANLICMLQELDEQEA